MNSYLLFLPNAKNRATALQEASLSSVAGGEKWFESPSTPSDEPGLFCAWGDPKNPANDVALVYDPSRQTWKRGPGGKWWLGIQNDRRPGPNDLRRANQIGGKLVTHGIRFATGSDVAKLKGADPDHMRKLAESYLKRRGKL